MSKNIEIAIGVVLIIIVGYLLLGKSGKLGGAALPSDISSTNFTQVTANGLTVNTSNTATSTTSVGCIQTTATSTATAIRLTFSLPSQNAATTTTQGGASIGNVVWQYGTCPI